MGKITPPPKKRLPKLLKSLLEMTWFLGEDPFYAYVESRYHDDWGGARECDFSDATSGHCPCKKRAPNLLPFFFGGIFGDHPEQEMFTPPHPD